jgi:hypothetical protein
MKPKFTRMIDGIPTMTVTEHEAIVASLQRQWVGLSVNEATDFYESKLSRAELIYKIDEFLEEKNNG